MKLISQPNKKLGLPSFDIMPVTSCPGKSKLCNKYCYALRLTQIRPIIKQKYQKNLKVSKTDEFLKIVKEIPRYSDFRIHVSGDFHSIDYIKKWISICEIRYDTKFFTFTRSWRNHLLFPWIKKLASLPNVTINLSCDKETGYPTDSSFRWAYMSVSDTDIPSYLRPTDIVFRTNRRTIQHKLGNTRVCPLERGIKNLSLTCNHCRICINKHDKS